MAGHIFISYSSHDAALANRLVAYLEQQGYPCWIAPRDIASGGDYTDFINDSIRDCRALVLVMTERSVRSQWVKKELSTAVSYNRTILPFRIEPVKLESGLQFLLNNVQWIDATSGKPEAHFGQLVNGINHEPIVPLNSPNDTKESRWGLAIVLAVSAMGLLTSLLLWHPWRKESAPAVDSVFEQETVEQVVKVDTVVIERTVKVEAPTTQRTERNTTKTAAAVEQPAATAVEEDPEPEVSVSEPVVQVKAEPEPEPEPEPVVTQPVKRTPTAAELAAERYNRQFKKAKRFYDAGNYRDALPIFEALKREKPADSQLDPYIRECRKHL